MSRPAHVYADELFYKGYGYPLWIPQPTLNRRSSGLLLGDFGHITEDGAFEALTNLFCHSSEIPRLDPTPLRLDYTENVISQVGGEVLSVGGSKIKVAAAAPPLPLIVDETVTCDFKFHY